MHARHPGLLTEANGGELKLVAVPPDFARTRTWHNTSRCWVNMSTKLVASAPVKFSVR